MSIFRLIHVLAVCAALAAMAEACSDGKPAPRASTTASISCPKTLRLQDGSCKAKATGDDDDDAVGSGSGSVAKGDDDDDDNGAWLKDIDPMGDEEAVTYLKGTCGGCHVEGGALASFYPVPKAGYDKSYILSDQSSAEAYYAMVQAAKQLVSQNPSPMPQNTKSFNEADLKKLKRAVKWFVTEMPTVVATANKQFTKGGARSNEGIGVAINYKCAKHETARAYIVAVTRQMLGRDPKPDDLMLADGHLDEGVTKEIREKVATKLFDDAAWKSAFEAYALKNFADRIVDATAVTSYQPKASVPAMISDDQAADLKKEFYQKLKREYATKAYKDIILSNKVWVTAKTASLYGCPTPAEEWGECEMQAPRDSIFTTIAMLRSKESSFLMKNNNYGRAALIYFIVRGDQFKNANDKPPGDDALRPLPACLKSNDYRGVVSTGFAPSGTMAIPTFGNLCQSCHIDRQMATGSLLFRRYNQAGLIYGDKAVLADDEHFVEATGSDEFNRAGGAKSDASADVRVNAAFLQQLLDDNTNGHEIGCVAGSPSIPLPTPKSFAEYLIGADGSILAGGLARHIPRYVSNVGATTEEIINRFDKVFSANGGKLAPLFQEYLRSETFSCDNGGSAG